MKKVAVIITSFGVIDQAIYHNHLAVLLQWKKDFDIEVYHLADNQQEASLNLMVMGALAEGVEFILFLEHDNVYKKDLLQRLMKHELDVVTGYYPFRNWPYEPIPLKRDKNGLLYRFEYSEGDPDADNLMDMSVGCFGCCLVKAEVMKDLLSKGLAFRREYDKKSQSTRTPDIVFFQDLADNGYQVIVDGNARAGHLTQRLIVDPDNYRIFRIMMQLMNPGGIPEGERMSDEQRETMIEFLLNFERVEKCST
jgi:hypothetical protein